MVDGFHFMGEWRHAVDRLSVERNIREAGRWGRRRMCGRWWRGRERGRRLRATRKGVWGTRLFNREWEWVSSRCVGAVCVAGEKLRLRIVKWRVKLTGFLRGNMIVFIRENETFDHSIHYLTHTA